MRLTEEQIARKKALGIPVHLQDSDHGWRADGFCNCGALNPRIKMRPLLRRVNNVSHTTGRPNLDIIEGNGEESR